MRTEPLRISAACIGLGLVLGGCAAPPPPPSEAPTTASDVVVSSPAPVVSPSPIVLQRDTVERHVRNITVRLRSVGCGVGTGSGFVLGPQTIVTNRHVVAGASKLQVNTWDGHTLDVDVSGVAVESDLAVVRVAGHTFAEHAGFASSPAAAGDEVAVVGFPGGGEFSISAGQVIDRPSGRPFGELVDVIRVDARVVPGNSGGPLLDADGEVVGVVYAVERATGLGLAVPLGSLEAHLDRAEFYANPPVC